MPEARPESDLILRGVTRIAFVLHHNVKAHVRWGRRQDDDTIVTLEAPSDALLRQATLDIRGMNAHIRFEFCDAMPIIVARPLGRAHVVHVTTSGLAS